MSRSSSKKTAACNCLWKSGLRLSALTEYPLEFAGVPACSAFILEAGAQKFHCERVIFAPQPSLGIGSRPARNRLAESRVRPCAADVDIDRLAALDPAAGPVFGG